MGIPSHLVVNSGIKDYPLAKTNIALENGNFPLKMVIFHSYVNLPEGMSLPQQLVDDVLQLSVGGEQSY